MSALHRLRQPPRLGDDDQLRAPNETEWYDSSGWSNQAGIGSGRPSYVTLWSDKTAPSWSGRNMPFTREVSEEAEAAGSTQPATASTIQLHGPSTRFQGTRIVFNDNTPETLFEAPPIDARVGHLSSKINADGVDKNYRGVRTTFASPSESVRSGSSDTSDYHSAEWFEDVGVQEVAGPPASMIEPFRLTAVDRQSSEQSRATPKIVANPADKNVTKRSKNERKQEREKKRRAQEVLDKAIAEESKFTAKEIAKANKMMRLLDEMKADEE